MIDAATIEKHAFTDSNPPKMFKYLIYIPGKLNDITADKYIKNLSLMLQHGELVRELGASVICPGNDLLQGLFNGTLEYNHYIQNSMSALARADALYLVPGWEDSPRVQMEVEYAKAYNIPICGCLEAVKLFLDRPKILCIIGESGTGKSLAAQYLEDQYKIELIRSHTDRPARDLNDTGHTFHTKGVFDELLPEEMIAYTEWDGYRYCCLTSDVKQ